MIHTLYQLHGGEDAVVEQQLELLKQQYTVEVLYFQNQGGYKGALQFLSAIWNRSVAKKIQQKIKEFQPDVVHVHNWHFATGPLLFRMIHGLGIPIVHTVHNYRLLCPSAILLHKGQLFTDSLQQRFPWSAVRLKVYRSSAMQTFWLAFVVWFHKQIGTWKKIDSYICLTPFSVMIFQQSNFGILSNRFAVKPNFTRVPIILSENEREKHFLFIGRLSEEKGIATLLAAFKESPFVLKIGGDGPFKEQVINATNQFSNITYLGNLSNLEVTDELQKTQALISPSVCYEGMPMTILEAFSTGTPVIASNLGAMTSMILNESNGFLFESGNVNDLKGTILKFDRLSLSEKKQMGKNAFDNYQTAYSPELQLRYFDTIYNTVLKNNND
ncbi:glycosyltransferase [Flavobacterium sp. XS2P24]|uniref:glycosyltransferase n=1 Tax=Flavobacterium sp. XS2P24 TaxID=3041249 RepID=UPI0024A8E1B5|nr:glycosyltransferase [Flavobacterium sp. XS2P24]